MKAVKTLRGQAGFSLIELMVVVAIIGILATMSVGAVQKQILKSRQSESKSQLASLYTSEKSFFAEYNTYSGGLNVVGYQPEGNMRYIIGFSANTPAVAALTTAGYNGVAPGAASTQTGAGVGACVAPATANGRCFNLPEAVNAGAFAATGAAPNPLATATTFDGQARSMLRNGQAGAVSDVWSINQAKTVTQGQDGIQ